MTTGSPRTTGPVRAGGAANGKAARRGRKTYGGADVVGNTKSDRYERAKRAGIGGRSKMSKSELAEAIARKQA